MSALGHYLEEEGIPTTQISLVREHTAALAPPRALWVPFMLGRPFGVPNDAAFQRKVLRAVLQLLAREAGPVLEDFPEDAPHEALTSPPENLVCPVSFPSMNVDGTVAERLALEVSQLGAWHELALKQRKRTTLGITGLSPSQIAAYLGKWLGGDEPPAYRRDIPTGDALKQACEELRAFYYEAKAMQPGKQSSSSMHDWFWFETSAGLAMRQLKTVAAASGDASVRAAAVKFLIPRTVEMPGQSGQEK